MSIVSVNNKKINTKEGNNMFEQKKISNEKTGHVFHEIKVMATSLILVLKNEGMRETINRLNAVNKSNPSKDKFLEDLNSKLTEVKNAFSERTADFGGEWGDDSLEFAVISSVDSTLKQFGLGTLEEIGIESLRDDCKLETVIIPCMEGIMGNIVFDFTDYEAYFIKEISATRTFTEQTYVENRKRVKHVLEEKKARDGELTHEVPQ
jgi:hypothetical protein